ncbi:trypsin-1-like [Orussus abietinus]|uniref:trypsin-1-like n=1 Tax=Orussus abietinus TaxID=222816 RepID=UPI000C715BF5|nr:trypsin-1-like [Orussus abietinus]
MWHGIDACVKVSGELVAADRSNYSLISTVLIEDDHEEDLASPGNAYRVYSPYRYCNCNGGGTRECITRGGVKTNWTATADAETVDKTFLQWIQQVFGNKPGVVVTTQTPEPENPQKCQTCKCGLTNKNNRIVGGVETLEIQYPWMTALMYRGRFYCGGSLISSRYVLTAAHCVEGFQKSLITIRLLEHNRNTSHSRVMEYKVQEVIRHGAYSTVNYNNDIALLKIAEDLKFSGPLRPVCLPERGKTFSGEMAIVTGWGALEEGGVGSSTLQEVTVPILSNAECRATKYPARRITDNMLCAGFTEGSKDSCQGDSGGPLHVVNETVHHIAGVVSWGEGCAQPNYPGVYSRVNRFLSWIERNTADSCYC